MKTLIISALALIFVSHVDAFNAQQKGEKTSNMQEMLKATQPSERHKQLESLAGRWDVLVRITNVGIRTDPITGESKRLRIVTTLTDKDHYTVEWFQPDGEGKEEKRVTLIHTRKGT